MRKRIKGVLSGEEKAKKNLISRFYEEMMKLPPVEREKLIRRYETRYIDGMALSFAKDVEVLGREEAEKRLAQVVKDRVDFQLILSKAKELREKKKAKQ